MTVCYQCLGKGATKGLEAIIDVAGNTQTFQPNNQMAASPCSACGGTGIMRSFGV